MSNNFSGFESRQNLFNFKLTSITNFLLNYWNQTNLELKFSIYLLLKNQNIYYLKAIWVFEYWIKVKSANKWSTYKTKFLKLQVFKYLNNFCLLYTIFFKMDPKYRKKIALNYWLCTIKHSSTKLICKLLDFNITQ